MSSDLIRVYADTSVYGGAFDFLTDDDSKAFFNLAARHRTKLISSPLVEDELVSALEHVREYFEQQREFFEFVDVSPDAERLKTAYIEHGVLSQKHEYDALHVAVASANGCKTVVSWNFRHMVNLHRSRLFGAVNLLCGYNPLDITTPFEIVAMLEGD